MVWKKITIKRLKKQGFSLVLSGGAAYGISHIGVLKFLEENNLQPEEIIGTSMGAVVGAFYAIGKSPEEMERLLKKIEKMDLFKLKYNNSKLEYFKLHVFLKDIFKKRKMKDTKIDLKIMTTEMKTGQGKLFTKEDNVLIYDVVLASSSIPSIFSFKKIKNKYYMDGGIASNLPVEYVKKGNIKIASNVINNTRHVKYKKEKGLFSQIKSKFSTLSNTLYYLIENQTNAKIPYIKNLVLIEPNLQGQKRYKLENYKKLIKKGYDEAKKVIKQN